MENDHIQKTILRTHLILPMFLKEKQIQEIYSIRKELFSIKNSL